jgi:hypothetical protein
MKHPKSHADIYGPRDAASESGDELPPGWRVEGHGSYWWVVSANGLKVVSGLGSREYAIDAAWLTIGHEYRATVEKARRWEAATEAAGVIDSKFLDEAIMVSQARPERLWDTWAVATARAFIAQQDELADLRAKAARVEELEAENKALVAISADSLAVSVAVEGARMTADWKTRAESAEASLSIACDRFEAAEARAEELEGKLSLMKGIGARADKLEAKVSTLESERDEACGQLATERASALRAARQVAGDLLGGYSSDRDLDIFQHGMQTIVNMLAAREASDD